MDFFVVNFKITTTHQKCHSLLLLVNKPEDMRETVWNDTSQLLVFWDSKHCMCFTTSRLTICENCSIVAFDDGLNQGKGTLIINCLLERIRIINRIVGETLWWCHIHLIIRSHDLNLLVLVVNLDNRFWATVLFLFVHGSYSDHDLDSFCICFRHLIVVLIKIIF